MASWVHGILGFWAENILILPDVSTDLESKEPWLFEEDDAVMDVDRRRSPGQMIEDDGAEVAARLPAKPSSSKRDRYDPQSPLWPKSRPETSLKTTARPISVL